MKEREVRKRKRSFLSFLLIMAMVIQTLSPMAVEAKTIDAKQYDSLTSLMGQSVDAGDEIQFKQCFGDGIYYCDSNGTELYCKDHVNIDEQECTHTVLSYQDACAQSGGTEFQLTDSTFKCWKVTEVYLSSMCEKLVFRAVSTLERSITYECADANYPDDNPDTFIVGVGVSGIEPAYKWVYDDDSADWTRIISTGWYRNPQFTGEPVTSIPATETENVTLYAKFPAVTHTITYKDETDTVITTFVSGAGTTVSNPSVYEEGVGVSSLYDAYKEGFLFGGWYTDLDNENTKVTEIGSNETDNITLFAKFIPTKSINYELYGGTLSEGAPTYYAVGEGIPADNMPTATKAHHDFTGWYESANDGAAKITSIATDSAVDLTLHAKYTPKTYEIVYHDGETTGAAVQVDNPGTYTYGGAEIASLNHADKTGQEFLGWYRESSLENAVTSITADNVAQLLGDDGKLHLYAKYAANTYNITYHDGDSILTGSAITTYTYGTGVTEENMWQPTKAHYTFGGWYSDNTLAADKKVTSIANDRTGDIDLYAKFTGDVFNIVYLNENDGTVSVPTDAAVTYTYGEDPVYPCYLEPGSIVAGHRSAGWFKDKNFDNDASEVSEITTANAVQLADSDGTIRLYTKFVPMTYKLEYYVDGEQVQVEGNPDEYVYGTAEIDEATLKDATKDGYRFDGWYSQGEPVVKVGVINDAIAELAVYVGMDGYVRLDARFTKMYEVVYHDGSKIIAASGNPNAASYPEGATINLQEVSKDGYDFGGWYADSDLQGAEVTAITAANTTALTGTDGKLHLYAKYTPKTYSIKYMVDGTENTTLTPKTYTHGTGVAKQAMPSAPAKQNYDFDAWYTEPDGGGTKMESIPASKFGNLTLYANYTPKTYTITYMVDGANDTTTGNPASYVYGEGAAITKKPVKEGYTFKGWYGNSDYLGEEVTQISNEESGSVTLYGKFVAEDYQITYIVGEGATAPASPTGYTYGIGVPANQMPQATKTGWSFKGWYSDDSWADNKKVESIGTTEQGNKTLYAKFEIIDYAIEYYYNGGQAVANPTYYHYGTGTDTLLPTSKNGYTFDGWYLSSDFEDGTKVDKIAADMTGKKKLYAKFTPDTYAIAYQTNGGTNSTQNPVSYTYGIVTGAGIELNPAEKTGYDFKDWYSDAGLASDSAVKALSDANVYQLADADKKVTLYAAYTGKTYDIVYETNGGTNATTNPAQYQCGTGNKVLAKATKENYVCDGWYSTASFAAGTEVTELNDAVVTSLTSGTSVTLYAKYTGEEYEIEYKLDGGTNHADNPTHYNFGTGVAGFEDASKPHYVFNGWYNNDSFVTKIEKIGPQESGNKTLYAKFTGEAYTIVYHLNDGSNHTDNKGTYLYGTGGITLKDAKKDGYTPDGWYTSADLAQTSKVTTLTDEQILALAGPGKTIHLYAGYTPNQYNIVYHDGTATNAGGENETSYTFGTTLALKDGAAKNGYDFKNWFAVSSLEGDNVTSITAQNALDLLNAQDGKLHLYAKYDHASYPITYETNGGVLTGSAVNLYTHGTGIAKADMAKAEKDYYDFEGWYGEAALQNKVESISTTTYGAIKLYANYTPKEYEIRYHLQTGDTNGEGNPTKYTYGVGVDSFKPATRRGYTFKGWFDNPDLITGEVTEITAQDHGDMLLWPKFEEEDYKITYIVDGKEDNAAGNPTGYKFGVGVAAADLKDASKNGYAFDGWYRDLNDADSKVTSIGTDETGDLILYAKFTGIVYTIQYETDGGTNAVTNPSQYQCGTGDKTLADAAKEHYAFLGWYSNENFTQDSKVTKLNDAVVTGLAKEDKVVLYAKYAGEEYDIEYKLNGGQNSATNPVKYTYGTGVEKFEDAAKEHYEFIGWYDNEQLTGDPVSSISTTATGKKTLWARFEGEEYTIEYVLNDGINAADNPHTYTYGNGGIPLKSATRPGYTFDSFYTTENFAQGTAVKAMTDAQIVAAADDDRVLTLYAKFTPDTYTITYQTNGGENSKENPTSYTYGIVTGAGIELKPAEKNGYEFKDWHADAGMTGNAVVKALSDNMVYEVADAEKKVTLYAEYTGKTYNIVYETNGGTNANTNPAQYQCGTAEVTLADATRTNYGFGGWYSAADFAENTKVTKLTDKVVTDLEKNGTVTLYAKLTGDEYEIEYKTDGGQNPAFNPAKYTFGKGVEKFEDAVKEHYEFMGWYDNEGFERDRITSIREDESGRKTLWAKFEGEEYTIDYRLDGGSNAEDNPETYRYGTGGFTLKPAVKENYTFVNFYTTENFAEGTAVKTMTDAQIIAAADDDRVITLYAQYAGKEYEIEYVLNGGTNNEANPTHYNHAVGVAKFEDATKEYYVFEGWYDNAQFDGEKVSGIGAQESGKKTLYAKFTPEKYKITYVTDGTVSGNNPTEYDIETEIKSFEPSAKEHYTFDGWYTDEAKKQKIESIAKGESGDKTLYAKFTADTFKIKYELFGGTNDVSNPAGYTYGVGVAQLKAASKPGYIFAGWYRNANFTGNSVTSITAQEYSDVTLYAKYVEGPKDLSLDERSMNDIILSAGLVITQSPEQIKVKWGKVKGADGYEVYVTYCHLAFPKTPIRVTTKKTNKTNFNKILGKDVNLRRDFKVYVKAFKKVNGKKVTIAESIIGHMAAINHTKYTNVEKLKVKKKVAGIKVGQTFKIKAKTTLMAKGKKQLSNKHEPEFRYISTNPGVAQVDEKGVITAIGKGKCVVYLFARDGRSAYVRVKVS